MSHYHLPHNHGQNIERVLERMPPPDGFQTTAAIFQQLGDPSRLRILWLLCHSEECVCNIAAAVGMSDPAVSHHLRILKKGGIIESRRDGKEVYYTLAATTQAKLLHRTIDALFEITCPTD
ncbi:ArsR family transcriptional regulator [Neglecta sp. X4]|uniref:ArsR/SmtB family transcription factor n=1 Tax=unclassified Neglectibacter TaxID=2632164 RepID=UPI00136C2C52|nr:MULTISPECIES: metalloregulator ArsR/SmtB family transcription factor [unclassified Neglectibacter]NBI16442.1 ArsR family transcriptional regulator [Neglectibacter sp. 59]NBJ72140.1 ArsR family transcriptional regulator [Neglectibacter sp. X4]NCE79916.1 ArsR family transcriptional regulator [Neglectibacter sp. X58]